MISMIRLNMYPDLITAHMEENVSDHQHHITHGLSFSKVWFATQSADYQLSTHHHFLFINNVGRFWWGQAMKVATRPILNVEEEFKVLTKSLQETLELQDEKLHSLQVRFLYILLLYTFKLWISLSFPVTTPLGNKDSKHTYIHTWSCDTGKFRIIVTEVKLDGKFAKWGIWASGFNVSKRGSVTGSQETFGREGTAIARTARTTKQHQS